jgi:hypothetical protein
MSFGNNLLTAEVRIGEAFSSATDFLDVEGGRVLYPDQVLKNGDHILVASGATVLKLDENRTVLEVLSPKN